MWRFFVCFSIAIVLSNADDDLVVRLPVGAVQGVARQTVTGVQFYSFQGIPFAEPPINNLRFMAPKEKSPWSGVLDATKEKNSCYQLNTEGSIQNEDCLFINIFTPRKPSNSTVKLTVMFFIYGGGFTEGYSTEENYGPQHLMETDVILVTSNYRTGAFGFLSTEDLVMPGNAGLKDQTLALEWTNKYISYFGGDPSKITIFGQSAGAASVGLHILSPLSTGLFRAAISESGAALSPFAYQRHQKLITYKLLEEVNQTSAATIRNSQELLEYLQSQPAAVIQAAAFSLVYAGYKIFYPGYIPLEQGMMFAPVIEVPHDGAFLSKRQFEILEFGSFNKVPWLVGFTAAESLFYLDDAYWKSTAGALDANHTLLIPTGMNVADENREKVAEMINNFYAKGTTFLETPRKYVDIGSDQTFTRPIMKQAMLHASHNSKVYLYTWRYLGAMAGHTDKSVEGFSNDTRHGEELSYIFARQYPGFNTTDLSKFSAMDRLVLKRFITLVTTFAKELNPTPYPTELMQNITWPEFSGSAYYLDIGSDLAVRQHPIWETYSFWETLYRYYGTPPYDTY